MKKKAIEAARLSTPSEDGVIGFSNLEEFARQPGYGFAGIG
jgi:hypothetical protein